MKILALLLSALAAAALYSQTPNATMDAVPAVVPALDTAAALEDLGNTIHAELSSRRMRRMECGVKIVNLTGHRDVFAAHAGDPLTPASTMKLFTSSAALGFFGPSHDVTTEVLCDTLANGVVQGDLYLRGHGDPTFSVGDLDSLIDLLKARGIKHVTGDVIGDASFFDDVVDRSVYSGDGEIVEALPPISALTIDRNTVVVVAHAGRAGERVRVQTVPHVPCIALSCKAVTVAPRAARRNAPKRSKHRARSMAETPFAPAMYVMNIKHRLRRRARSGVRFAEYKGSEGRKQSVVVTGALAVGGTAAHQVDLADPPLAAASMLLARLQSEGIAVDGEAVEGTTPATAMRLAEKRAPLVEILSVMNKNSDNFIAEHIFKMIGAAECRCEPRASGLADSSVKYIKAFLSLCKVNPVKCEIHDGSGLSHHTAITPDAKVGLLRSIHANDSLFRAFYGTLAIGGVDGTIKHRMRGTPAENNVRAKTGTLNSVSALAGYVTTRDGELWAFDITMNGGGVHYARDVQDRIVESLAGFSYSR